MSSPRVLTPTLVTVEPSINFAVVEADTTTFALVESSVNQIAVQNPLNSVVIFC